MGTIMVEDKIAVTEKYKLGNKYHVLGKSVPKKDVLNKVLGKSKFGADYYADNMVHCKLTRSKHSYAILRSIDASKALAYPGVVTVLTYENVPGLNRQGELIKDEPVLVRIGEKIRKKGDPIACVVAETAKIAEEAAKLITYEADELQPILTVEDALAPDADMIYDNDHNYFIKRVVVHGDVDEAFKKCDIIVENDYKTQIQEHAYIEPEGGFAVYDGEVLTIYACSQNVHLDALDLAENLEIPMNKLRVVQSTTGGGFGGKLDLTVQPYIALAAMKTGRPAKMVFDRKESMKYSVKRHPFDIHVKTGADKTGKIIAFDCLVYGDSGAYASLGPATLTRTATQSAGPYEIDNVRAITYAVTTNNPQAGAMRGFGVPQMAFAVEQNLTELAEKVGIDPIQLRKNNAYQVGSVTPTGQVLQSGVGITKTLEAIEKEGPKYIAPKKEASKPYKKRGVGVASMWYGIGNTGFPNPSGAFVEVLMDGTVHVKIGAADIGQGSDTTMCQIVAEVLGVPYQDVRITSADTGLTPDGGASSASRQTYVSGNACRLAAESVKQSIIRAASVLLDADPDDVGTENYCYFAKSNPEKKVTIKDCACKCHHMGIVPLGHGYYNPPTTLLNMKDGQGIPYGCYAYATQMAEIEVDMRTGHIDVLQIVAAHDVGTAVNPINIEAQIQGGCTMGLGLGLMEEIVIENGEVVTPSFASYMIPTALDVPIYHSIIIEEPDINGPFGAKGVGEPSLIPTAAAIANALYDATGVRIKRLPLTPENVLAELKKAGKAL